MCKYQMVSQQNHTPGYITLTYSILQKNPNGDFFVLSHLSIFRETVWL